MTMSQENDPVIHCICCEEEMVNMDEMYPEGKAQVHPENGTVFHAYGNYGSTVFDPMDGSFAEICICNECLENKKWAMNITKGKV
jgi:hypothetical protein